jgi:anti-sigma B factor antagonist
MTAMAAEDYQVRWAGQQAVVATPAEIDVTNADEARQALLAAASLGAEVLIIDMSRTTFCDSAGVHAIITVYRQTLATRTQLRLVATAVLRILTLVGTDQLIPIYPTLEAAQRTNPTQKLARTEPEGPQSAPAPQTRPDQPMPSTSDLSRCQHRGRRVGINRLAELIAMCTCSSELGEAAVQFVCLYAAIPAGLVGLERLSRTRE